MHGTTHIGTSGWQHRHWRSLFYPDRLKVREWLAYYADRFDCVEVDSTFYRLPGREVIAGWRASVPSGFVFAVKAPRRITHFKKLKNCADELAELFGQLEAFESTLGPVVFQLPPRWRCNLHRLERFLGELPAGHRPVFEFRDPTWHNDEVYEMLASRSAAFGIFDAGGSSAPMIAHGDLIHVRLQGPGSAHTGAYRAPRLRNWVDRARGWSHASKDVFLVFDDDERDYAIKNATRTIGLLNAARPEYQPD